MSTDEQFNLSERRAVLRHRHIRHRSAYALRYMRVPAGGEKRFICRLIFDVLVLEKCDEQNKKNGHHGFGFLAGEQEK